MTLRVGELFALGFRGLSLPEWLLAFEQRFGLGGVILFDRDARAGDEIRNVESPRQLTELCAAVHRLASRPLTFVDQEGGRVRRLRPERGFRDLPSAKRFAQLPEDEARALATESFREMKELGIDFNLAPVVDLDLNPENPNIGALGRAFSLEAAEVRRCVDILGEAAASVGLQLCLKHYPGLGGATTDSHAERTALRGIPKEQIELFTELCDQIPGAAILLSHGIVPEWDTTWPVSVSETAIARLRRSVPGALLLTDDLQMEGLRRICPTREGSLRSLRAGADLVCIGNNLHDEETLCERVARAVDEAASGDDRFRDQLAAAQKRVRARKERAA